MDGKDAYRHCWHLFNLLLLQYKQENGVVYPNIEFILDLNFTAEPVSSLTLSSGDPACSDITSESTSCNVTVPRDVYNVSVTLNNDIGSAMNNIMIDSEFI